MANKFVAPRCGLCAMALWGARARARSSTHLLHQSTLCSQPTCVPQKRTAPTLPASALHDTVSEHASCASTAACWHHRCVHTNMQAATVSAHPLGNPRALHCASNLCDHFKELHELYALRAACRPRTSRSQLLVFVDQHSAAVHTLDAYTNLAPCSSASAALCMCCCSLQSTVQVLAHGLQMLTRPCLH